MKIGHVRPEQHGLAIARRLEQVVASAVDEAAADKRYVAIGVARRQIAESIEKQNVFCKTFVSVGAAFFFKLNGSIAQQLFDFAKTLRMARRQHHLQIAKALFQGVKDT